MVNHPKPTTEEVREYLASTRGHSLRVESYLHLLGIENEDKQRPHDLVGSGNKYTWPIIKGLALEYGCHDKEFFKLNISPSIDMHRKLQHHHQMWNKPNNTATDKDMMVGAVDTICSIFERRPYQQDRNTLGGMVSIIDKIKEPHKLEWIRRVYPIMERFEQFDMDAISSSQDVPNLVVPRDVLCKVNSLTLECIGALVKRHNYPGLINNPSRTHPIS